MTIGGDTGIGEPILHIFVPNKTNYSGWITEIKKKYKDINIIISTIEESI